MQLFIAIIILLLSLPVSDMEEMKRLYENEERGIILGASAKFEEAQRVLEVSHSFYYWRNINLHYLVANDAAMGKLETDLAQHFFEALSFSRDNQTEQALKTISVLIVNKPEYIPFYFYRAAWYQDCNNNTLAIQDYCKIIDLDSLSADAYLRRGQIYFNEKKYKSAIFDYRTYFSLQTIQPLAEDECIELKLDPKFKNNTYKIFLAKNYFLRENFLEA